MRHGVTEPAPRDRAGDEVRLTLLLFLLSFLISGVPRVYTQTAAHALFIEAHGASAIPWAYLAEALCVPLAGALYIAATRRFSLRALLLGTLASQALVLLLLRSALALQVPLAAGAAMVYFEIEFVLSSLLLWGLSGQLMTLRQGKRRFGWVSAGEPVAVIVCGLSTPALLQALAPADLLLLSAAAALLGMALVLFILQRHAPVSETDEQPESEQLRADATPWWRGPYVGCMVALVALGQLAYFFVDNAFYLEAGHRYPDAASLASFLGLTAAVMGAVSLVCGALVAPWMMQRFGVRGGLLALPVLLSLGALTTLSAAALGGAGELLFLLLVGNKVIDQSLRYTLDKTTFVTLLQPLPGRQRLRVQAGLESVVEPLTGGLAALLLMLLLHAAGVGALGITAAVAAVAGLWAGLVVLQYRGYLGALRQAVREHGLPMRPAPNDRAGHTGHTGHTGHKGRTGRTDHAAQAREALLAEIDCAALALAAWSRLQQDQPAGVGALQAEHAAAVSRCLHNCFGHLEGLLHDVDLRAAYRLYVDGSAERRSYVMELLDNLLDAGLKARLMPLLEPHSLAERAQRMQRAVQPVSLSRRRAAGHDFQ